MHNDYNEVNEKNCKGITVGKKPEKESKEKQDKGLSNKSKGKNKFVVIGIIAAVIAAIAVVSYRLDTNTIDTAFAAVDGIPCETQEYSTYHVHAHLDVFVNGQRNAVPAGIGIPQNKCLFWMHTHSDDGIIHIESPKERQFTLGEFIDIWKATSSSPPPSNGDPIIFVNGAPITTKLQDTILNAHDEIVLAYGGAPSQVPSFYQFAEGL